MLPCMYRRLALLLFVACGSPPPPTAVQPPVREQPVVRPDAHVAVVAIDAAVAEAPPAIPDIPCDVVVGDGSAFPPVIDAQAPEREWTLSVRRHLLLDACGDGWDERSRACIARAGTAAVVACLDHIDASERDELLATLTSISELATKISAARKKPAAIGCKQVVAAHYGDAKWKGKLESFKAAERKKMIAASRAKMTKACTDDAWSETLRACIVAGGEETCFQAEQMGLSWGYPAAGTVTTLGIPECDAYGATLQALSSCSKFPEEARKALTKSFDEMRAHMAKLSADERTRTATSCKAGLAAVKSIAQSTGC